MDKLNFSKKTPWNVLSYNKNGILNFQNLYSVYLFNHKPLYKNAISSKNNYIFSDGKILSIFLKTRQVRGPTFTRNFFKNKISSNQKHFIIGPTIEDFKKLIKKYPKLKKSKSYDPPFIKGGVVFPKQEINKIVEQLRDFKPDFIWVCIGNPKQEILANQLYKEYKTWYFNVGAAMDFLLGKKKEAPSLFRKVGLEWFYRLITDFKYSKKKVWRSLIALRYLRKTVAIENI